MNKYNTFKYSVSVDQLPNVVDFMGAYYPLRSKIGRAIDDFDSALVECVWNIAPDYYKLEKSVKSIRALIDNDDDIKFSEICESRLFDKTYWGNFVIINRQDLKIYDHAFNRDQFAVNNNLVKLIEKKHYPNLSVFDHLELYKSGDGCVFAIASTYHEKDLSAYGFQVTAPMYSESASTWYRKFADMKEYIMFCEENK